MTILTARVEAEWGGNNRIVSPPPRSPAPSLSFCHWQPTQTPGDDDPFRGRATKPEERLNFSIRRPNVGLRSAQEASPCLLSSIRLLSFSLWVSSHLRRTRRTPASTRTELKWVWFLIFCPVGRRNHCTDWISSSYWSFWVSEAQL